MGLTPPQVEKFPRPKEDRTTSPRSKYHSENKLTSPPVSVTPSKEIRAAGVLKHISRHLSLNSYFIE